MRTISTKCIVLGHKNFGEADKLLFIYSEDLGKVKVIARGARKITSKFTGHLETLSIFQAELYFSKNYIILREVLPSKQPYIHEGLEKINSALQIAEVTNQVLYEEQSLDRLTQLIEETLNMLKKSSKPFLVTISYIIKLLDKLGILPEFDEIKTNASKNQSKYFKFFQFIKTQPFAEIEKISLSQTEKNEIRESVRKMLEYSTERSAKLLV